MNSSLDIEHLQSVDVNLGSTLLKFDDYVDKLLFHLLCRKSDEAAFDSSDRTRKLCCLSISKGGKDIKNLFQHVVKL